MNRLKELREFNNISQNELAKVFNVSQNAISQWETEKNEMNYNQLIKFAEYFECTIDYLVGKDQDVNLTKRSEQRPALITKNPLQTEEDIEMKKIWQELTIKSKWIIIGRALAILEEQKKNQR